MTKNHSIATKTIISIAAATAAQRNVQDKANAIFDLADDASASFAVKLAELGIATRADAKPFAMTWAAKKYHARIEQGQRGDKLPRDSAAEKAMQRVLAAIYGSDNPFAGGKRSNDESVALPRGLVKKLKGEIVAAGCTKAQFTALLKALREEITFS